MDNKKTSKFEIDIEIKDMLWTCLHKWRLVVIMAAICGIALAAYQYRTDMNKTDVVVVKKTQEELEKAMGTQDLDEVTAAVALKRQIDEKSAYMENSALMQINPYEENVVFLQYYVSDALEISGVDIADIYKAYIEKSHLSELVSIYKEDGTIYVNSEKNKNNTNIAVANTESERSFVVKVIGVSNEEAMALAETVKTALQNYEAKLQTKLGVHELLLLDEMGAVVVDQKLAELQSWNATAIKASSNNLDSMKNEMTSDQITLYVYRTTVPAAQENENTSTSAPVVTKTVTISVKHAAIGAVIGVILGCAIAVVMYLFASALRNKEEVKTLYGVKMLGCIDDSAFQKKKLFGFVDAFLLKLQNAGKTKLSFEQEVQMICANIALDCQKNNNKKIVIASSVKSMIPEAVLEAVTKKCGEKGIEVTVVGMIAYDAQALETLAIVGNVVFIEKERTSLYDELYKEILLCKENGIYVAGMIVLG